MDVEILDDFYFYWLILDGIVVFFICWIFVFVVWELGYFLFGLGFFSLVFWFLGFWRFLGFGFWFLVWFVCRREWWYVKLLCIGSYVVGVCVGIVYEREGGVEYYCGVVWYWVLGEGSFESCMLF